MSKERILDGLIDNAVMSTHDALELAKKHVSDKGYKPNIVHYESEEAMFNEWIKSGAELGNISGTPDLIERFADYYTAHVSQE
jgi:hypothetical protein